MIYNCGCHFYIFTFSYTNANSSGLVAPNIDLDKFCRMITISKYLTCIKYAIRNYMELGQSGSIQSHLLNNNINQNHIYWR
jgi:hypothetical protein